MKYNNVSLGIGIFVALGICIYSVSENLRSSPQSDQWAILFLLWPCVVGVIARVITEICVYVFFKAGMRSLNMREVDIQPELEKIARDGTGFQKMLLHTFNLAQLTMNSLAGIFICSIFLAPYLLLH